MEMLVSVAIPAARDARNLDSKGWIRSQLRLIIGPINSTHGFLFYSASSLRSDKSQYGRHKAGGMLRTASLTDRMPTCPGGKFSISQRNRCNLCISY